MIQSQALNTDVGLNSKIEKDNQCLVLIDSCASCVDHCLDVIRAVSNDEYALVREPNSSIGAHMRHIIERITCVTDGAANGHVNYDIRARDRALEEDRGSAEAALVSVQSALQCLDSASGQVLGVAESVHQDSEAVVIDTTLERELMSLVSHTIHHLAIISLLARAQGIALDPEIGKAPSTIIFERAQQ